MKKIYDYKEAQKVIQEAWNLAVNHLEETLGEQYKCNATENALPKFFDYIEQDINYLKVCPVCKEVDEEGNFLRSVFEPNVEICYDCYTEERSK